MNRVGYKVSESERNALTLIARLCGELDRNSNDSELSEIANNLLDDIYLLRNRLEERG